MEKKSIHVFSQRHKKFTLKSISQQTGWITICTFLRPLLYVEHLAMLIKTASETYVGGLDGLEISRWEYRAAYIVLPKAATATTIRFILIS